MISRIIKVKMDITKTESKKESHGFAFSLIASKTKHANLT